MAGGELRVDTGALRSVAAEMEAIGHDLHTAEAHADGAAAAVGHPELAAAVRSFTQGWEADRAEMVARIERLGRSAVLVADTVDDADTGLAGSLGR